MDDRDIRVVQGPALQAALNALDAEWHHLRFVLKAMKKARNRTDELIYLNRVAVVVREMLYSAEHASMVANLAVDLLIEKEEQGNARSE